MKLSANKTWWAAALVAVAGLLSAAADELDLLETLRSSAHQAVAESGQIDAERKRNLQQAAAFIRGRQQERKSTDVTFICTQNSRRSHLSQLWAQTAALYYGVSNVTTFSGGTNPVYLAQFSESRPAVKMYSKVFSTPENPQKEFAALFCCDSAAAACPVVPGAGLRLPILYVDPKVSDNSPKEQTTYDERSRQIAREMFFLMSQVSLAK